MTTTVHTPLLNMCVRPTTSLSPPIRRQAYRLPCPPNLTESTFCSPKCRHIAAHQQSIGLDCLNQSLDALSDLPLEVVTQLVFEVWVGLLA